MYILYMLTMVMDEWRWIGSGGYLRVIKIRDRKITYGERMRGVCDR